jgi:hypothetical protein
VLHILSPSSCFGKIVSVSFDWQAGGNISLAGSKTIFFLFLYLEQRGTGIYLFPVIMAHFLRQAVKNPNCMGEQRSAAKNRAFRSKSSQPPMRLLWAFRCNPLRTHGRAAILRSKIATSRFAQA